MWYVIQVRTGKEEEIRFQCEKLIEKEILEKCFIPHYEQMKRYQGKWHKEQRILFPGYVFRVSDAKERLPFALKRVTGHFFHLAKTTATKPTAKAPRVLEIIRPPEASVTSQ